MTPERLASTSWRKQLCSSVQLGARLPAGPVAPLRPPKGSPSVPSQCSGSVPVRPRTGMVVRSSSSPLQAPKKHAPPMRHSSWSMLPSGWQLSQEKVSFVEANAFMKAMRPLRTASGVGSLPTRIFFRWSRALGSRTSTTETVFSSVFST